MGHLASKSVIAADKYGPLSITLGTSPIQKSKEFEVSNVEIYQHQKFRKGVGGQRGLARRVPFFLCPLRRMVTHFWRTFWALFGGLFVANPLPPTPFRNLRQHPKKIFESVGNMFSSNGNFRLCSEVQFLDAAFCLQLEACCLQLSFFCLRLCLGVFSYSSSFFTYR